VYASPLKRAHSTASALHSGLKQTPAPPLILHPDLREQNFGVAEGHPWFPGVPGKEQPVMDIQQKIFPTITSRSEAFPGGESLDDLATRAGKAIDEIVIPAVIAAKGKPIEGADGAHLVIVSHGLCISELIGCLAKRAGDVSSARRFTGLENTAWSRVIVGLKNENIDVVDYQVCASGD
jgi:broad specificity phosphatase PhoE